MITFHAIYVFNHASLILHVTKVCSDGFLDESFRGSCHADRPCTKSFPLQTRGIHFEFLSQISWPRIALRAYLVLGDDDDV
jgi:hypothetical protein